MPDYLRIALGVVGVVVIAVIGSYVFRRMPGTPSPATQPTTDRASVQVPVGGVPEDWGHMPLRIAAVFENQLPLDAKPWHAGGGDWTFLDCTITAPQAATITVGVHIGKAGDDNSRFTWGDAVLAVPSPEAADAFLNAFASAFYQKAPSRRAGNPPGCIKMHTAVLGTDLVPAPGGGFGVGKGTWTATKWFLQDEGYEAEVFFNFSIKDRQAEFSEKDEEYRADLMAQLAMALRDGPLPERTPANDPTLSLAGPTFKDWQRISQGKTSEPSLSRDGLHVYFVKRTKEGSSVLCMAALEHPERITPVARMEHHISSYRPLGSDGKAFLVVEQVPECKGQLSSADPATLWLVTVDPPAQRRLDGPWGKKDWYLASDLPSSPDGRFIALGQWVTIDKKRDNILYCLDQQTGKTVSIGLQNQPIDSLKWEMSSGKQQMAIITGFRWDKESAIKAYRADPLSGKVELSDLPQEIESDKGLLSPDRKKTAKLEEQLRLIFTDESGKTAVFAFHEYDRRFALDGCIKWVSPRYLLFHGLSPAFIDANTLKMNYPLPKGDPTTPLLFSPDFSLVVASRDDGLYVGKVVLPE